MKEHKTDINTTLDIQARAEAIATDIAAQTQFCITAIQSDINDLTQQMETVGSVYRHAASLYSLLKAWVEIWNTNGSKYKEQPSKSAWVSPTYSMYPQQWSLATTDTMGDARRPEHKQRQKIRSPFLVLPPHIRALAPHQARFWWKFGLEDRNDFLLLRETMLDNPLHATDGKFHAIDKKREVRCLIYNWDSVNFDSDDVCAYIRRLDLGFVDELLPKMGGKIPILDIRAQHMTPFLWALLERRSGFIEDFTFSICQSVGIDDGSAPNVAWANLTHLGRKYLQNTQIPDGLQDHILRVCGVPTICSTQSLDNDWAHATCSTGRFAISVQKKADWITIQTIPFAKKYINVTEITGMGSVLGNAASKGELAISATMGPFPLDIQELPSRTMEGPITRLLQKHGLEPAGFKRTGGGWKCSVRIGFPSEPMRTSAAILLSRRCHPGINGGKPLQVVYVWDVPSKECTQCYHPDNPPGFSLHPRKKGGGKSVCPNITAVCALCHNHDHVIAGCGKEYKHQRVANQQHFEVTQSSLTAGSLASLGMDSKAQSSKAPSIAKSVHSTSQVRNFFSDEGTPTLLTSFTNTPPQTASKRDRHYPAQDLAALLIPTCIALVASVLTAATITLIDMLTLRARISRAHVVQSITLIINTVRAPMAMMLINLRPMLSKIKNSHHTTSITTQITRDRVSGFALATILTVAVALSSTLCSTQHNIPPRISCLALPLLLALVTSLIFALTVTLIELLLSYV